MRKKVVVKRLNAIQNFGAMEVLCTDKIDTLMQGRIILKRLRSVNLVAHDFARPMSALWHVSSLIPSHPAATATTKRESSPDKDRKMDLVEMIEALEAAKSAPERLRWQLNEHLHVIRTGGPVIGGEILDYYGSLDAAVLLVPKNHIWHAGVDKDGAWAVCGYIPGPGTWMVDGQDTPAHALAIVALKARRARA